MDIGMIGFHAGLYPIDISGLTDAFIAHSPGKMIAERYDPAYVLDKRPSFFVLVGSQPPEGSVEKGLFFDPAVSSILIVSNAERLRSANTCSPARAQTIRVACIIPASMRNPSTAGLLVEPQG